MYKLLIIDDEYLVRLGLKETISWDTYNIEIVGEAKNGQEGLEKIEALSPDIVILDIKMPVMDGLEVVKALQNVEKNFNIIILSGYRDFEYAKGTLEQGVFSYLLKPIENEKLIQKVFEAIEDLEKKRKNRRFIKNIRDDLPKIYSKFILDVLTGKIYNIDEIKEKCETYQIVFPLPGHLLYGKITDEHRQYEQIKNILKDLFEESIIAYDCKVHFYKLLEESFVIFFECLQLDTIIKIGRTVVKRFEKMSSAIINMGVSSEYDTIKKFRYIFKEAKDVVQQHTYLLMSTVNSATHKENMKPQIQQALAYISEHYYESLTVKSVSEAIYVSDSYLMHNMKDQIGMTFNEYVTDYRMKKAKELLRKGTNKIYEISSMVGYNDVKYFSQVFRKNSGLTPSEYIEKER